MSAYPSLCRPTHALGAMTSCRVPRNTSLSHSSPERGGRPARLFLSQDEAPPVLPAPAVIEAEVLCTWGLRLCDDRLEFLNNFNFEFMSVSEVQQDSEAGAVTPQPCGAGTWAPSPHPCPVTAVLLGPV